MKYSEETDDPRRRQLILALSAGLFSIGLPDANAQVANIFGTKPARLPPKQSIYRISGSATVNDKPAWNSGRFFAVGVCLQMPGTVRKKHPPWSEPRRVSPESGKGAS